LIAHNKLFTSFSALKLIINQGKENTYNRKNKKQSLLLLLHPFCVKISKAAISSALVAEWMTSLVSSRCSRVKNYNVPLKIACIKG
jgi:hypothetical protein